jgi:hypothetical protein
MLLRRLSILGSMILTACVPSIGSKPVPPANCYNQTPTRPELAAWRAAVRQNTAEAYRSFIRQYPNSCYVPMATAKIGNVVKQTPPPIRNVPITNKPAPKQQPIRQHNAY